MLIDSHIRCNDTIRISCPESFTPGGRKVEYAHRFPACRMRRVTRCPDGSASKAWDYHISCVTSTGMPAQNAVIILNPFVSNPHSAHFTNGANWVAPFEFFLVNDMQTLLPLKKSRFHFLVQIVAQCSETNEKNCDFYFFSYYRFCSQFVSEFLGIFVEISKMKRFFV